MKKIYFNILDASEIGDQYKLCYIDDIERTVIDYSKSSKGYSSYVELPNPLYKPGISEYYAYFTDSPLSSQWGDDWNDAPYDCNAGEPYSDKSNIVVVPFGLPDEETLYDLKFPCSYGCNCPWSVEEINLGAVPWIFIRLTRKEPIIFNAGIRITEFIENLNKIKQWEETLK